MTYEYDAPSLSRSNDAFWLAFAVWREARGEPLLGQIGVAHSIMNRVIRPTWWGRTVMEVIFRPWQYSSFTDPKDKQLTTWPKNDRVWHQCLYVACGVLDGVIANPVPGADSYFDISITGTDWATPDKFVAQIGRIKFYNVDRDVEIIKQD
jgi:spore germination cell wall hydrolase CwlJ-like protein